MDNSLLTIIGYTSIILMFLPVCFIAWSAVQERAASVILEKDRKTINQWGRDNEKR